MKQIKLAENGPGVAVVHKLSSMLKCNATCYVKITQTKWPPNNVLFFFWSSIMIIIYAQYLIVWHVITYVSSDK